MFIYYIYFLIRAEVRFIYWAAFRNSVRIACSVTGMLPREAKRSPVIESVTLKGQDGGIINVLLLVLKDELILPPGGSRRTVLWALSRSHPPLGFWRNFMSAA